MSRIRILMPITSKGERSVASYLLEQRRNNSGLEVCVVLTSRQGQDYLKSAAGEKAAACNRIIAAADHYEVVPGSLTHLFQPALFRLFIERCDYVIFNEQHAGVQATWSFRQLITDMTVPLPVQYGLVNPGYAYIRYPFDRREYRTFESGYYDTSAELRQSIGYIAKCGYRVQANRLPQVFVRMWQAAPPPGWYRYLTMPDDTAPLFHLQETPRHDYLALKVFAYTYALHHKLWATTRDMPSGAEAIRRFGQFGQLVAFIAAKRKAGELIEPFDLLEFDGYDKLIHLKRIG